MDEMEVREEMTREELEQEIANTEKNISEIQAELESVKTELNSKKPETDAEPVYDEPQENVEEEKDPEIIELEQREQSLTTDLVAEQMKLVALQKRLNDILANEAMENYNEEE